MANAKGGRGKVTVVGPWQPMPLAFLRSRACAELSPHATKLLLDCLAMLAPNGGRNGDISLAPKVMAPRGWNSRETLGNAVAELSAAGLLIKTRQGSRLDCSLFALTLYPLDCDLRKLDVRPGCYSLSDWTLAGEGVEKPPTEHLPARWNRVRKAKKVAPQRNKARKKRSTTEQKADGIEASEELFVPPRDETR